jgi:hypothetical protein
MTDKELVALITGGKSPTTPPILSLTTSTNQTLQPTAVSVSN